MSKEAITKVVQRAISDAGFRRQLSADPTGALRGFDLSADEAAALRAGDAGRLSALGVDQRMSKAFALGGATVAASRYADTDLGGTVLNASANSGLNAAPNAAPNSGLNSGLNSGPNAAPNSGLNSGPNAAPNSGLSGGVSSFNDGGASAASNTDASTSGDSVGNALVTSTDEGRALVEDGASGVRNIIPTNPDSNLSADADVASGSASNAYIDDSETYLTKVGYDPDAAAAANADARETTWSGDDIAGPSDSASAGEGNMGDQTGDSSITR